MGEVKLYSGSPRIEPLQKSGIMCLPVPETNLVTVLRLRKYFT
jgi:hypothetical protein